MAQALDFKGIVQPKISILASFLSLITNPFNFLPQKRELRIFEELLHAVQHYKSMRTVVCVICKLLHVFRSHKIDFFVKNKLNYTLIISSFWTAVTSQWVVQISPTHKRALFRQNRQKIKIKINCFTGY